MKKMCVGAICLLLLILGGTFLSGRSSGKGKAEYPFYRDVPSMTQAADVIVVCEVAASGDVQELHVSSASAADENDLAVYTVSQVCVQTVLKGGVNEGDMLAVKQPGDYLNDPERSLKKLDGYLKKGDRQLLFLREYETSPYSMLNAEQGGMRVEEDGTLYSASEYALFRGKTNGTELFVTLEDAILQIQEVLE